MCVCVCVHARAWVGYGFTVSISLMAIYLLDVQKNIYFCLINYMKAFDYVDHNKLVENSSRDGNTRPPYPSPEKSLCRSRSNSQNRTWNNGLVQNWERNMSKLYTVTLFIQFLFRVHHVKCLAGLRQTGIKIAGRNINNFRYADDTILMAESKRN